MINNVSKVLALLISLGIVAGAIYGALAATELRWTYLKEHRALEIRVAEGELGRWIVLQRMREKGKAMTAAEVAEWCTLGLRLGVLKSCG